MPGGDPPNHDSIGGGAVGMAKSTNRYWAALRIRDTGQFEMARGLCIETHRRATS